MRFLKVMLVVMFFLCGCSKKDDNQIKDIPLKENVTDNDPITSPINTINIDQYLFRDDVQYVDLRASRLILEEGYVSGFEFIPFYNIIGSHGSGYTLYKMKNDVYVDGKLISPGQVGSFEAQFEESESIIRGLFNKNKYIFFISQGGTECGYMINLLIQLGYDGNLLYNVGGVSNSEGVPSYRSIETNKYYVAGHSGFDVSVEYNFIEDLTPITK